MDRDELEMIIMDKKLKKIVEKNIKKDKNLLKKLANR